MTTELQAKADALDQAVRAGDVANRGDLEAALAKLVRHDHGLEWRYIPAGRFRMGSEDGDPDEAPVHTVELRGFWMAAVPLSWWDYCRLLGWTAPPTGTPALPEPGADLFSTMGLAMANKIRLQYCEDETLKARDWHAHDLNGKWESGGKIQTSQEIFGHPERSTADAPYSYREKPIVSVSWQAARELAESLSSDEVSIDLPTEAQWERAARGLLAGARYPWGDDPPSSRSCDFDGFSRFAIQQSRSLPANDYGLHGMSGGVWEWCLDQYDFEFYRDASEAEPLRAVEGDKPHYVLRGGSWTDDALACTVSFRMAFRSEHWREGGGGVLTPNVGFRLILRQV